MIVAETKRLVLRWMEESDAAFILELTNDPAWLEFIGDRGIHSLKDAVRYINDGPQAMYAREGFGLFLVERKADAMSLGICGILKRPALAEVDIGFAFLPAYRKQGYGYESAMAVKQFATDVVKLKRLVAITSPQNTASIRLLEKLGLTVEKTTVLPGEEKEVLYMGTSL